MSFMDKPILVTGAAGFIGFHLCNKLLQEGHSVVGIDNINDYYSVSLKEDRLKRLQESENFSFFKIDLVDKTGLTELFEKFQFDFVVNLAAQAGVRYSLTNPDAYSNSNIVGFVNLLDLCKNFEIKHLVYASSSSVYGANTSMPFNVSDNVDHPISLYAASKKSNELLAHAYSSGFNLPTTGLRFFTVYGPWGRPDMALFLFTKAILEDKPIDVYNHGDMQRDFTYVDDIVNGISLVLPNIPKGNTEWDSNNPDPATSFAPYRVFNIGNNKPVKLMDFIEAIENHLGKEAKKNMLPIQVGDVPATFADCSHLIEAVNYRPETSIEAGIKNFIDWYRDYYKV